MIEVISVLKHFTNKDIKKFKIFINSEYFNTNKNLIKLFNEIIKFKSNIKNNKLNSEYVSLKIKIRNKSTFRNLLRDLKILCERYLAQHRFENYRYLYKTTLIEELHARSIPKLLYKNIVKVEAELNDLKNFHSTDFHLKFVIENIKFEREFLWETDTTKDFVDKKIHQITKIYHQLFYYYFLSCQDINMNLLDYHQKMNKSYHNNYYVKKIGTLANELGHIIKNDSIDNFYLNIFRLHSLLKEMKIGKNKLKNFVEYYKILSKISNKLDIDEKYNFYTAYSYLFPEIMDHPGFQNIELSFYDMYFKNFAYKNSGREYLPLNGFKYFYTRADTLGRYEWTDKLFTKNINAIEENLQTNIVALRNSYLYFRRYNNFDKALRELNKVKNFSEPTIKRDIYYLYVLIFYEKEELEMVQLYIKRLKDFLEKEKLPNILQNDFILFANNMKKMVDLKTNNSSKYQIKQFLETIKESKKFPSKPWLIEKIIGLEKNDKSQHY